VVALSAVSTGIGFIQVSIFVAFIVAAILFRRLYIRDGLVSHAFLSAGLVVAAFSQLHFALDPVVASGVLTSSDALRLAFYAILVMGIQAELGADFSALRHANAELRRLREVDAANATLAERTRLAREIHDGLAQDLWYAKLKQGRLAQNASLDDGARSTAGEVLDAIDSALAEARQAVMAMRVDPSAASSLEEVIRSYVEDFADRFGVRAEFQADGTLQRLPPRTEAEVLRIVQEALNNVRRHADATLVRVKTERDGPVSRVSVSDNGRGFDPLAVPADRFGLRGMRERAELVGGTLDVQSRHRDGTRVIVEVTSEEGPRA
jgi:signal transduction histidine kinase